MWITYAAVMVGGAIGVGGRMFLSTWVTEYSGEYFPWATFVVNVLGCFTIGVFGALTEPGGLFDTPIVVRQVVMIGVLGGFTTFSSFTFQTLALLQNGNWLHAGGNVVLSVVTCLLATAGGLALVAMVQPK